MTGQKMIFSALAGLSVGVAGVANATLISYESFSGYTVGTELTGQTAPAVAGYTGDWSDIDFGDQEAGVLAGSLDYTGAGYPNEAGDRAGVPTNTTGGEITAANSGRTYRLFDASLTVDGSTTGTRYLSFLFQSGQETGSTVYQMLHLQNGNGDGNRAFDIGITENGDLDGNEYGFGVNNNYGVGAAQDLGLADSNVHLFVVRFDLSAAAGSDSVTVWIDPTSETGGTTVSGVDLAWDRLALSDYDGNSANWDEIRWGTEFSDVTVPEPGSMALIGLGCLLISARRHKA